MSDEREQDAGDLQVERLANYLATATPQFIDDDLMVVIMHNAARAAANAIRRLTAERDAARAELAKLRAALEAMIAGYGPLIEYHGYTNEQDECERGTLTEVVEAIRAALGIESEADHD